MGLLRAFARRCVWLAVLASSAACNGGPSFPDAPGSDVLRADHFDAARDLVSFDSDAGIDATDAPQCVIAECEARCRTVGFAQGGICTVDDVCVCAGSQDASVPDAFDATLGDTPRESNVTLCMSSAECAPSQFCSGPGCDAAGFCYPRGPIDGAACEPAGAAVCGCDGMWYASTCARLASGVRLDPLGAACAMDGAARLDAHDN